jgi:subtilisin-like proprotein convertase family protein
MLFRHLFSIATVLTVLSTSQIFGQVVTMGDPGYPPNAPVDCSVFGTTGTNFQDPGQANNYPSNFNDTIVFCPELPTGTKMSITFGINAGFEFNVDGSDSVYVYDGPNTSAPLLGVHNSVTNPTGFTHLASWNNPTGCLTVVFISDIAIEGTGWLANVQCGNQAQPYTPHLEAYINGQGANALNPIDTGYVDICFGDSVLFILTPDFPFSLENTGYGYSQSADSTVDITWSISNGTVINSTNSIWFKPSIRSGFLVDVTLQDLFPQTQHIRCKVRVSQLPSFVGTYALDSVFCLGDTTQLVGGVTALDTVGVDIPPSSFTLGGSFAGLTYLPDGSGQQYDAPIQIAGFPDGATIDSITDLHEVCITMEHSFCGDLEIWLTCPSGDSVQLINSFAGTSEWLPGGTSGGGKYLGQPYDDSGGGGQGIGWEYCFSSTFNTIGAMSQNWTNTISVPSVPGTPPLSAGNSMDSSDIYAPETSFTNLIGCPVNGTWTIHIQDNLANDDGYIFEWGLFFDGRYFPGLGNYQNYVVTSNWDSSPAIISGQNDTLIYVSPTSTGVYPFTFNVTDDFGCHYDTTITIRVVEGVIPDIFDDTLSCGMALQVSGTQSQAGGVWTANSNNVQFDDSTSNNPLVTAIIPGIYTISFTDSVCQNTLDARIFFPKNPKIFNDTVSCDFDFQVSGTMADTIPGMWASSSSNISFQQANELNPTIHATNLGIYVVSYTDICNHSDTAIINFNNPKIFGDTSICWNEAFKQLHVLNTISNGGHWVCLHDSITFSDANLINPIIHAADTGLYYVSFVDHTCKDSLTSSIYFSPNPWTEIGKDTNICLGTEYSIFANQNYTATSFTWLNNSGNSLGSGPELTISSPGVYYIEVGNSYCPSKILDSIVIGPKICDIEAPNIMILSSNVGNEGFFIKYSGIEKYSLVIVDRWGIKMFESANPEEKWTPKVSDINEGTYFYIIKAKYENNPEEVIKQGFIQVKY